MNQYISALVAGLVAGTGAGATAAIDDRITYGEWWLVAAATVAAAGAQLGVAGAAVIRRNRAS